MERLQASFFERDPVVCARELIGGVLMWDDCSGRIVETEAYAAEGDPACHTFSRPSARRFVAEHPAGAAYVYLNYGVHWLFNVLVKGVQADGFVLVRALEPVTGEERMRERRGGRERHAWCSGPGKLTQALGINGQHHGGEFLQCEERGIRLGAAGWVDADGRIGISRGQELPWRFTERGNPHLSQPVRK